MIDYTDLKMLYAGGLMIIIITIANFYKNHLHQQIKQLNFKI